MKFCSHESSQSILKEVEKHSQILSEEIRTKCSETQSRYLQQGVEYFFKICLNNPKELLLLILISWWLPEELGIPLRLQIEERYPKYYGVDWEQRIFLMLQSKPQSEIYILESNTWKNTNEFFGSLLAFKPKVKVLKVKLNKPRRAQRHRGYRDKGSRRLGFEFISEEEKDFTLQEKQLRLEYERQVIEDSKLINSGFLE